MKRKTILITAGPTREKIDPIRFLSNESSGQLGYEIAKEAKRCGHKVILILGPTHLPAIKGVKTIKIESAAELHQAIKKALQGADILFMTSAVSDFSPIKKIATKIKRSETLTVRFKKNPDILKAISTASIKKKKIYVGFCLETSCLLKNATRKLKKKRLDYIVATQYSKKKPPFGGNSFSPVVLSRDLEKHPFPNITKTQFAKKLLNLVLKNC